MTGGRASSLHDPHGRHVAALDSRIDTATRLSAAACDREDGAALAAEFRGLVEAHATPVPTRSSSPAHTKFVFTGSRDPNSRVTNTR